MQAYISPAWTIEAIPAVQGAWLVGVDWVTIAATVLIGVGTTVAAERTA